MPVGLRGLVSAWIAGVPFLFLGCDQGDPAAPPQPVGALYECRGEPGYSGSWDEILKGLDSSGVVYCAPPPTGSPVSADTGDSVRVHAVLLDGGCRYLETFEDTLTSEEAYHATFSIRNGRMADGSILTTGEYFLNTVREWPDGRKDTSWYKFGMVRTECGTGPKTP